MDYCKLAAALAATVALAAPAMAAPAASNEGARLTSQYSTWAGGAANAEALVSGMHSGAAITLVTHGSDRNMSLAGFTPSAPMGYGQIDSALGSARRSLARVGISHPTAEQIQAALIGGEVALSGGRTQVLAGTMGARGNPRVATR
jgi:hypothetical protein